MNGKSNRMNVFVEKKINKPSFNKTDVTKVGKCALPTG